ncbi:MAG: NADH-quinone oxidoreductase subunit C [Proteobacteria bacterium]|nr:NADH-quinone oxidoreductase subunit C [Pseudomonadota bacterium]
MNDIAKNTLEMAVATALGAQLLNWTSDVHGNHSGWVKLGATAELLALAPLLADCGARLMTVTAYRNDKFGRLESDGHEIAYHFDLEGVVLTVSVCLPDDPPRVASITPWFKNADWNEREFAELYGIVLEDHPNPRRLFLDKGLDAAILNRLVPLSTMMNGASTTTLWEKVFAGKQLPEWAKGGNN